MTTSALPLIRCECGSQARPWRGYGTVPSTCEACRKRDAQAARDLYDWKRRQAKAERPARVLSDHPRAVKGRVYRAAMLARAGLARCACGRTMPRLAQDGTDRRHCDRCRPRHGVEAMLRARGVRP